MNDKLKPYALGLGGAVLLALLVLSLAVLSFAAGRFKERVVWVEKARVEAAALPGKLKSEYDRGAAAGKQLRIQLSTLQTSYSTLEGKYGDLLNRVPVVVARPVAAPRSAAAAAGVAATAPGPEANSPTGGQGLSGLGISRAGVWMWNSSLAGADVPAGACGLADTSDTACAADSGVALEDAWDNQHLNAKTCAVDRLRYQALIDFLNRRPTP